jgi:small-conductance mechanosensitive channel
MVASVKGAVRLQQLEDKDVFLARSFNTQLTVLRRSVNVIVFAIGMSIALSAFDWFSSIGMSLLASAGLLGIIIGIGAQRSLANIFAGLQLALTQPVRIGDMVVFEGEWGYIEDITYTYVVLRIWDLRRMIVPTTKIIDEALYNFSRGELTLYGTVYLYLDYSMPIEIIRERLKEIVAGDENHDGNIASVLVTDCRDWVMEVRVLVSAHDGLSAWYLRCKVREQLIAFLQEYESGRYLPRSRVVMEQDKDFGKAESASYDQQTGKQMKSEEEEKGVGSRDDSEAPVDENKEE